MGESLPARGAWIEILRRTIQAPGLMSLPARGAWIEISSSPSGAHGDVSLPARGAWIEILWGGVRSDGSGVAPRTGSVD